jgi:hypothetical protein
MASGGAWGQAAPGKTLLRELPRINEVHIDGLVSELYSCKAEACYSRIIGVFTDTLSSNNVTIDDR